MKTTTRIATATLGLAAATGIALGAAGAAHAGTLPITRPGEPTVAMTITNHTDKPEYLQGANADGGRWVNAPQHILYPGATETITATAPYNNHLDVNAIYRIGLFGPTANYQLTNHPHNVNTDMTTIWGPHAQNYWINPHIDTGYPQVNVGFDQW